MSNGLEQFDDDFNPTGTAAPVTEVKAFVPPRIPNGIYTLTLPDEEHRSFKIFTKKPDAKFAPGKRVIGLLAGPDNTADYQGFGFVDDAGIHVWKRYRGNDVQHPSRYEFLAGLLWELATGGEIEDCSLLVSKRCLKCGRVLTDPTSLELGIGPTCRGE
jgi:hypothetical protein